MTTHIGLPERPIILDGLEIEYLNNWIRDRALHYPKDRTANSIYKKLNLAALAVRVDTSAIDPNLCSTAVYFNTLQNGYLMAFIWDRAKADETARHIYGKLKEHAIAGGVEWYYGEPGARAPKPRPKVRRGHRGQT